MMVTYHRLCAQCVFCCVTWHILPGRLCRTFQFVTAVSMAVAPSTFSRFLDKRGTGIIIHNTHTAYKTLSTYIYVCRDKPDRTTLHGVHETRQHTTRHSHILRVLHSFRSNFATTCCIVASAKNSVRRRSLAPIICANMSFLDFDSYFHLI